MEEMLKNCAAYGCSEGFLYGEKLEKLVGDSLTDCDLSLHRGTKRNSSNFIRKESSNEWTKGFKDTLSFHVNNGKKALVSNGNNGYDIGDFENNGLREPKADADGEDVNHEEEYEIYSICRSYIGKNRTGFEENKDVPIVLNSVIAGKYYVTDYLGSAAFSKVFQAHDLHTGLDVCRNIIKNDKEFFFF